MPNPWYDEICEKLPQHRKYVTKTLTPAFQELVLMHIAAMNGAGAATPPTPPPEKADAPFLAVTTQLMTSYVEQNPEAIASGGILGKAKYWLRRTAASVGQLLTMIFSHPVLGGIVLLLSRLLRLYVCLQLSGGDPDLLTFALDSLKSMVHSNPVLKALIEFTRVALKCIPRNLVNIGEKFECFKAVIGSTATTAWTALSKYPRQFMVWAFRKLFIDGADGTTMWGAVSLASGRLIEYVNEAIDDPSVILDLLVGGKGLLRTDIRLLMRHDLFWLGSRSVFLGVLFLIPVKLITVFLNALLFFLPAGLTDVKHQLIKLAQRVTGDDRYSTVGHLFLLACQFESMRQNVLTLLEEVYHIFMSFGACFVERALKPKTSTKKALTCCVDPLVHDLLERFHKPSGGILAYAQRVLGAMFMS
jgi:hypothetical protein